MALSLRRHHLFTRPEGPLLLIIMDGVGIAPAGPANAVHVAHTPNLDRLLAPGPVITQLRAHGTAVGLPSDDDMGNSEVGHNALGAGRVFAQGARLVNDSIATGRLYDGKIWKQMMERCRRGGALHLIGLLSDGNVHSHIDQLFALIRRAAKEGASTLRVHPLLDGRDVDEKSALRYIDATEKLLAELNAGGAERDFAIASGGGRMVTTMDRYEADWSVVERGWQAHVLGEGRRFVSAAAAVQAYYDEDPQITDQYLPSFVVERAGAPLGPITDGDAVLFFNFRGDRAIEISRAFEGKADFEKFDRKRVPDVLYAGMMEYDGDTHVPANYLVEPPEIDRTVSEYLCAEKVRSFAISETQKYGHVTYFWNGNRSGYVDEALETYVEIPSDKIRFDKAPKMKAFEIADRAEELLRSGRYDWGRINFANGDMVGHTGVLEAAVTAMEAVDSCVGRLTDVVTQMGGVTLITADHGNCETMFTENQGKRQAHTAHTLNPVVFRIVDERTRSPYRLAEVAAPGLANVAATILNLLAFEGVADYEPSLIAPAG